MNWQEVCDDPLLRELPYKIELNAWGQIIMTPLINRRGLLCGLIANALPKDAGHMLVNCPIDTEQGVKVADIAWTTREFIATEIHHPACSRAPTLCVDIAVDGIAAGYYADKRELYFAQGAQEVWLCDEHGSLSFYDCAEQLPASRLFPGLGRIESDYLH